MMIRAIDVPKVSSVYNISGVEYTVAFADSETVRLEGPRPTDSKSLSLSRFSELSKQGEVRLVVDSALSQSAYALHAMSLAAKRRYEYRAHYVQWFYKRLGASLPRKGFEDLLTECAAVIGDDSPPSYESINRWCQKFWLSGYRTSSVIDGYFNRSSSSRLPIVVEDIISSVVDRVLLQSERPSETYVYDIICGEIERYNQTAGRSDPVKIPCLNSVLKRFDQIDVFKRIRRREGKLAALRKNARSVKIEYEDVIGARVEIDSQYLDLFVYVPAYQVPVAPRLTLILDVATRCILGWDLSLSHLSGAKTLSALKSAMAYDEFNSIRATPSILIMDNGSEFVNVSVDNVALEFGITPVQCSPKSPNQKPFVERLFGHLNTSLIHNIKGTKKSNPSTRGDYHSEEDACVTIEELQSIFSEWVTTKYHERKHSSLGMSPRKKFEELRRISPPRTYPREALDEIFCLTKECSISKGGTVQAFNMQWTSPLLSTLRENLARSRSPSRVKLLVNPDRIGEAIVVDPGGSMPPMKVRNTLSTKFHDRSLDEMKLTQELTNSRGTASSESAFYSASLRLYERICKAIKKGKKTREIDRAVRAGLDPSKPIGGKGARPLFDGAGKRHVHDDTLMTGLPRTEDETSFRLTLDSSIFKAAIPEATTYKGRGPSVNPDTVIDQKEVDVVSGRINESEGRTVVESCSNDLGEDYQEANELNFQDIPVAATARHKGTAS